MITAPEAKRIVNDKKLSGLYETISKEITKQSENGINEFHISYVKIEHSQYCTSSYIHTPFKGEGLEDINDIYTLFNNIEAVTDKLTSLGFECETSVHKEYTLRIFYIRWK